MMKSRFAGIPNILAGKEIFNELIQNQATKDALILSQILDLNFI